MNGKLLLCFLMCFSIFIGLSQGAHASISPIYTFVWDDTCINSTHLYREATINIGGKETVLNQTVRCQGWCDTHSDECVDMIKGEAGFGIPMEIYMVVQAMALLLLIITIIRKPNEENGIIVPIIATVLFYVLAVSSFSISTANGVMSSTLGFTFNLMMGSIMMLISFYAGMKSLKTARKGFSF